MSDYEDQFNPHSSSASGGDLYGLLNDMSSFSQQFEEQEPVVAAVLAQPEAGSSHRHSSVVAVPVEGMENLGLACYTQHTLLDRPKNRARTAVFSFSKIPDEERRFYSRHVASDLLDQQRHPGHGLRVKTTSFFDGPALPDEVTGEQPSDEILTHLVVVSTQPITFPRWHLAFRELKAKSVRVLHYVRTSLGKTQPGYVGVLSIFEGQTTIDELLRNRVIYHGKEHVIYLPPLLSRSSSCLFTDLSCFFFHRSRASSSPIPRDHRPPRAKPRGPRRRSGKPCPSPPLLPPSHRPRSYPSTYRRSPRLLHFRMGSRMPAKPFSRIRRCLPMPCGITSRSSTAT